MEYTSCNWIAHGLNFEAGHIEMCCLRCHVGGGNLIIQQPYNGEQINWDEFSTLKQKFIEENKKGIINPKCEGCFNLTNKEWDDKDKYFSFIHFNHWTHCNCKCKYCFTDYQKEYFNSRPHYSVLPIIKDMFDKKLFRPGGEITFAGGEPTILEEFEDLLNFLLDNADELNIRIHTSGIKYSPAVARGIREGKVEIVVSLDAGTKETFNKIKGVDKFDKVLENVKKYAQAGQEAKSPLVATKFIIFPEYNDSFEEVQKWLDLTNEAGASVIILDIEHEWFKIQREKEAMPEHIWKLVDYAQNKAVEYGIKTEYYNSARHLIEHPECFPNKTCLPNPYN